MKIQFLGTGAADWAGPDDRGEYRRMTSTLLDETLLIDATSAVLEQIADKDKITDVFLTHSHADHFDLAALKALAPCRIYAHESWASEISGAGLQVISLKIGQPVVAAGFSVLPMPANHSTERAYEQPLHYLIEKDGKRLLYATDGAWLLNREHHLIGAKTLDAAVFDATIGDGFDGDYRVFEHNSIDMVRLMTATLRKTGRLLPNAPVYLTHMARTLHGTQREIEEKLSAPFVACCDGLCVEI